MHEAVMSFPNLPRKNLPHSGRFVPPREIIAEAIARAMRARGMSVKQLAQMTGNTPKAVRRWLDGDNGMQLDNIIQVCRVLDEVWETFAITCGRKLAKDEAEQLLDQIAEQLERRRNVARDLHKAA